MNTTSDGAPTPSPAHRGRSALIAFAVVTALLVMAAVVVAVGSDLLSCSPPSQKELKAQEAFVLDVVTDAREVESGTADCDDNGDGYVYFTTDLTPERARDAFLAHQSCSPHTEADDEIAVSCTSGKSTVYVFFTATDDGATEGELNLS